MCYEMYHGLTSIYKKSILYGVVDAKMEGTTVDKFIVAGLILAYGGVTLFTIIVYTHLSAEKIVEKKLKNLGFTFVNPDHPLLSKPVKKPVYSREDIEFIYQTTKNL